MNWFKGIFNRKAADVFSAAPTSANRPKSADILVTRGPDLGQRFSLDASQILIGRGRPRPGQPGDILLSDRRISRSQAMLQRTDGIWSLEHLADSKSPTLVNDKPISTCRLQIGDQIQVGEDVLVIQASQRAGLSTLGVKDKGARVRGANPDDKGTLVVTHHARRPSILLHVLAGHTHCPESPFTLSPGRTRMGRSPTCDLRVQEPSISRTHVEFLLKDSKVTLIHRSLTNPTFINGELHEGAGSERVLEDGDEIAICESVVLKLDKTGALKPVTTTSKRPKDDSVSSLSNHMRRFLDEEQRLEQLREQMDARFKHTGSFLDIDVADSTGLKSGESKIAHIIVSFDAFRLFVAEAVKEHQGQVLNSNGDELMCFFPDPLDAVYCAAEIQIQIVEFNRSRNKLKADFRTRIGIHSGTSLVDLRRGKAYSTILDIAGHLQKTCDVGGFLISGETLEQLPPDMPFEKGPKLSKGTVATFKATGPLPSRRSLPVRG